MQISINVPAGGEAQTFAQLQMLTCGTTSRKFGSYCVVIAGVCTDSLHICFAYDALL